MSAVAWLDNVGARWTDSGSDMKKQKQETNTGLATSTLSNVFWISVAAIDGVILLDWLFNSGKITIFLLFFLTGGYGGA
jgi:hypothetical protein